MDSLPYSLEKLTFVTNAWLVVSGDCTVGVLEHHRDGHFSARGVTFDDVDIVFRAYSAQVAADLFFSLWALQRGILEY